VSAIRHSSERTFDAVAVVGSQGALQAFQIMVGYLPPAFPAAVVFDLHRGDKHGITEQLLARRVPLPVRPAVDGQALEDGVVHLAPADRKLLVSDDLTLSVQPKADVEPRHRSANSLLSSAARVLGPRLIAVILSGRLDGGAIGARIVKQQGGRVLVQDPASAVAPSMPNAALATGCVDFSLPPESLGHAILAMCAASGAAELFRVRLNAGVQG
jgi:two-component system chemotaxis response regulator CheB